MCIRDRKEAHNGAQWSEWERPLKFREAEAIAKAKDTYADEIDFWKMLQYLFFEQWCELKNYANERGIRIIGDVPKMCIRDRLKGVCANLSLWRMQDAVSGVVEGLRMGKLPREEEISDLEKCYQKTVVWVNLVKEQGITDF